MHRLVVVSFITALLFGSGCGDDAVDDDHGHPWIDANESRDGIFQCDPVAQIGCGADEKCTRFLDVGVFCAPNGLLAVGQSCTVPDVGADDCVAGAVCVDEVCRAICAEADGADACGEDVCCTDVGGFDTNPGVGVCVEETCGRAAP